jgi:hypothetical protein
VIECSIVLDTSQERMVSTKGFLPKQLQDISRRLSRDNAKEVRSYIMDVASLVAATAGPKPSTGSASATFSRPPPVGATSTTASVRADSKSTSHDLG